MVDDHDSFTKLFDVVEIVGGQQYRGAEFAIDCAQKMADMVFRHHVEADRRLVEKQQRRVVQQGRRQIAAHPFAERKFPDRCMQVIANPERIRAHAP